MKQAHISPSKYQPKMTIIRRLSDVIFLEAHGKPFVICDTRQSKIDSLQVYSFTSQNYVVDINSKAGLLGLSAAKATHKILPNPNQFCAILRALKKRRCRSKNWVLQPGSAGAVSNEEPTCATSSAKNPSVDAEVIAVVRKPGTHDASYCCRAWLAHRINLLQISVRCGCELSLVLHVAGGTAAIRRVRSRFKSSGLLSFLLCHGVEMGQMDISFGSRSRLSLLLQCRALYSTSNLLCLLHDGSQEATTDTRHSVDLLVSLEGSVARYKTSLIN